MYTRHCYIYPGDKVMNQISKNACSQGADILVGKDRQDASNIHNFENWYYGNK